MNRFLKYFLIGALCLTAFPKVSFAAALTCTSGADAGNLMCTCDTGTQTIEASSDDVFTEQSCNDTCHTLSATSWLLESCEGVDGAGDPILSTINNEDVVAPTTATATPVADFVVPILNVQIPGLSKLSTPTKVGDDVSVNFLAEYINALYSWTLAAGALVAVVMMMLGGLQYVLSRGKSKYIEKAKTRITNAITGLILLLAAYNIAFLIDPNTTDLKSLSLKTVDYIELMKTEESPSVGTGTAPTQTAVAAATQVSSSAPPSGVICDQTSPLADIVKSTYGHITFRIGGRFGKSAPYKDKPTKIDPNGVLYSTYCPAGQICLDCAGYVGFVADCAGLSPIDVSYGTAGIFTVGAGAEEIKGSYTDTVVNGVALIPGDLIGYSDSPYGHATIYIGNGQVAQNTPGRPPGTGVGINNTVSTSTIISQTIKAGHTAFVRRR